MKHIKTIYLAGEITGDPNYKKKFKRAEKELRERCGYIVLSPAVLPEGFEYSSYMRMTAAMLSECEVVCFLPGWEDSPGARAELRQAVKEEKDIFYFDEWLEKERDRQEMATLTFPAPKSCFECQLSCDTEDGVFCGATNNYIELWDGDNCFDVWERTNRRVESCPLIITEEGESQ